MKNKLIIAITALLVINNAQAIVRGGNSQQTNYNQFVMGFRGQPITANNMVDMGWIKGAVQALGQDGALGNLMDDSIFNAVSTNLWNALGNSINYYASLPQ